MRVPAALLACLALLAPRTGHAQRSDPYPSFPPVASVRAPSAGVLVPSAAAPPVRIVAVDDGKGAGDIWLVLGGATGGTLGFVAGAVVGAVLDGPPDDNCIDFCFGEAIIPGALIGEALGLALGVHLTNGRRGSFTTGALASAGVLALGITGMLEEPEVVFVIPVGQLIGAIYAERRTDRRR